MEAIIKRFQLVVTIYAVDQLEKFFLFFHVRRKLT